MMNLRDLFLRIRALVARRRVERELDEELAFHIERETQKQIAQGFGPAEARNLALRRFGSVPLAADQCRDARGTVRKRRGAGAVTIDPPGWRRPRCRRRPGGGGRDRPDGDTRRI